MCMLGTGRPGDPYCLAGSHPSLPISSCARARLSAKALLPSCPTYLMAHFACWLAGSLASLSTNQLDGLAGRPAGCWAGWLADWLTGCLQGRWLLVWLGRRPGCGLAGLDGCLSAKPFAWFVCWFATWLGAA
jgi:hypothetical protein